MIQEEKHLEEKYLLKTKKQKQQVIKNWIIVLIVLAIIAWGIHWNASFRIKV